MPSFTRDSTGLYWNTARITTASALVIADLILAEHDQALRAGDLKNAREIRSLWLEITDAVGREYFGRDAA